MNKKKCIVLDLDNTLWGGIIGEDGIDGIKLSLKGSDAGFIAFQQALLDLHGRGVILAINSKNNEEDAMDVIRNHPNMILKEQHFSAFRINWKNKAENIIDLAKELNIGLDSLVFFDDDSTNREMVRSLVPEVEVPDLPEDPTRYAKLLLSLPYFPEEATTDEDKMRGNLYVTERLRQEAKKEFESLESFLDALDIELKFYCDNNNSTARLSQLTEKTNQFNVNKEPLTENDVSKFVNSTDHHVFYGRLTDKFGDYGITNFAVIEKSSDTWNIKYYLMSCRVIGKGAEVAFLHNITQQAEKSGVKNISISFSATEKNKPAEEFIESNFKNRVVKAKDCKCPVWIKTIYG